MALFSVTNGHRKLEFEGEKIAFRTSEMPSKQRWTEVSVYLTLEDEWVIQVIGRTRFENEIDRCKFVISKDPMEVLGAILDDDVSYLSKGVLADTMEYLMSCEYEEVE